MKLLNRLDIRKQWHWRMWEVGGGMWDVGCGMWDVGCGMWTLQLLMYVCMCVCVYVCGSPPMCVCPVYRLTEALT
jgi:hypothetical protein